MAPGDSDAFVQPDTASCSGSTDYLALTVSTNGRTGIRQTSREMFRTLPR